VPLPSLFPSLFTKKEGSRSIYDYIQNVSLIVHSPLISDQHLPPTLNFISSSPSPHLSLRLWEEYIISIDLTQDDIPPDYHLSNPPSFFTTSIDFDSVPLVFLGYCIYSSEWNWDDFKNYNLHGKFGVCFVNEPPPTSDEPNLLTYYGRWTYKVEELKRRGAKGIILIHTTSTARYPFQVLSNMLETKSVLKEEKRRKTRKFVKIWITEEGARELAKKRGNELEEWFEEASLRSFSPFLLPFSASASVLFRTHLSVAKNVVSLIPSSLPSDHYIILAAHHDHLGIGLPDDNGDSIYNGACDNAVGVAVLLELGKMFMEIQERLKRNIILVSLTGEEDGLLGSDAFISQLASFFELSKCSAAINLDILNTYGLTHDIVGLSNHYPLLDLLFADAAAEEGMEISGDPNPGSGSFFRSDALSFAKADIPTIYVWTGKHFVGKPYKSGSALRSLYVNNKYHQPSDEYEPSWNLEGLLQKVRVTARLMYKLAVLQKPTT